MPPARARPPMPPARMPPARARPPMAPARIPPARARPPMAPARIPPARARPPMAPARIPPARARPPMAPARIPPARARRPGGWQRVLAALTAYKAANGHCRVPLSHRTSDGFNLGKAVSSIRSGTCVENRGCRHSAVLSLEVVDSERVGEFLAAAR
ncbi:hypothetical protein T492DRAFT_163545 [Pavlovales sp. CCMP2436]|nr:hypothetical protein T492DRAFT_163545 [Pavlovales sp. CCMP2436]